MHELDADGRAIGPLQDLQHLGNRRVFEAQIVVDEDLAAVIGLGEAVGLGIELWRRLIRLHLQGVEVGMQVPPHAIGADHHDGVDRVARRLQHVDGGRGRGVGGLGLLDHRLLDPHLDLAPVAVERRHQLAIGRLRPILALPARSLGILVDVGGSILEPIEIRRPGRIDRGRIGLVAGIQPFDVIGVAAIEERREQELFVLFLSGHVQRREA